MTYDFNSATSLIDEYNRVRGLAYDILIQFDDEAKYHSEEEYIVDMYMYVDDIEFLRINYFISEEGYHRHRSFMFPLYWINLDKNALSKAIQSWKEEEQRKAQEEQQRKHVEQMRRIEETEKRELKRLLAKYGKEEPIENVEI